MLGLLLGVATMRLTSSMPYARRMPASPRMLDASDVLSSDGLVVSAWQAACELPYTTAVVGSITEAVEQSPLAFITESAAFGPVASGLALSPAAAAAAQVVKFLFELSLASVLEGASRRDTISPERYERGAKLGGGSYGTVYDASESSGKVSAVIKTTKKGNLQAQQFAAAELFINQKLSLCGQSSSMAPYKGHFYEDGALSIVYTKDGELTLGKALKGDCATHQGSNSSLLELHTPLAWYLRVTLSPSLSPSLSLPAYAILCVHSTTLHDHIVPLRFRTGSPLERREDSHRKGE